MSFSQMINILRQKHKEEILLINAGAFYIAIEEDVVLLNIKKLIKNYCNLYLLFAIILKVKFKKR